MSQLSDLKSENAELHRKLESCRIWMERQVHESLHQIAQSRQKKEQHQKFDTFFESEILTDITRNIETYFSYSLAQAPEHTIERLLDAEIYWHTLQQFPHMDAFPIVAAYQKILDATFEQFTRQLHDIDIPSRHIPEKGIEYDISLIFSRQYSLSLGRWYRFLGDIRLGNSGTYAHILQDALDHSFPELLGFLISDEFFHCFELLIQMEVFQSKRHVGKVSFIDAQKTRDICTGNFRDPALFQLLFQHL